MLSSGSFTLYFRDITLYCRDIKLYWFGFKLYCRDSKLDRYGITSYRVDIALYFRCFKFSPHRIVLPQPTLILQGAGETIRA
jgi:hypothetical protein